ncbi:MAG: riboflavin synthase [Candidatus Eremiobacteraeota bacterium]|nr:riboflavin synthase [Candidatus Eremiobacteraeota bacterium]
MFSGLIAYRGTIAAVEPLDGGGATVRVHTEGVGRERPEVKDSIAIDGVCLTATAIDDDTISFDVVPETLARSTLGERRAGERVNVEYSLRIGDRMGGHFVYGHVDAALRVLARTPEGQGARVRIERPPALAFGIVEKAFIAIDGVSLTIAAAGDDWFEIALIPETLARTTLGKRHAGSVVNVELDPLARYVRSALVTPA